MGCGAYGASVANAGAGTPDGAGSGGNATDAAAIDEALDVTDGSAARSRLPEEIRPSNSATLIGDGIFRLMSMEVEIAKERCSIKRFRRFCSFDYRSRTDARLRAKSMA